MLSILDRGVIYVIAHIRGGGEMGRPGTRTARSFAKKNTLTDFRRQQLHCGCRTEYRLLMVALAARLYAVVNLAPRSTPPAWLPYRSWMRDLRSGAAAVGMEGRVNLIEGSGSVRLAAKSYTLYENIRPVRYPAIAQTSFH